MSEIYNVLVVDDELTNSILMKRLLSKANLNVTMCSSATEALDELKKQTFQCVVTDWMMPQIDGIELIRRIRETTNPIPYIIMVTALVTDSAKNYALESGADDYIAKPIDVSDFAARVTDGVNKVVQTTVEIKTTVTKGKKNLKPKSPAIAIATSTGGPPTLIALLKDLPANLDSPVFVVQHGPPWMLETFAQRLGRDTKLKVKLAENNEDIKKGIVYIAPGDYHIKITSDYKIILDDGPKENFVRPAADPLFVSMADAYGQFSIGVCLTGLGKDSVIGADYIVKSGGKVYVQDPTTAVAPSMPNAVINSGIKSKVLKVEEITQNLINSVNELKANLN